MKKLVIVGAGEFAEIAHEYFTHDSDYDVVGFAVEREYIKESGFLGLPVVPFEDIETVFPKESHQVYVAVTYTGLNRVRRRLFEACRAMGYDLATYVSSRAFVWRTAKIGAGCFIFENNVIQHGCVIGDDCVLWSGNHIGHRTVIEDHCYVSSHVVISGYCRIGAGGFLGVNATFADKVSIGPDSFVAAGAMIGKSSDTPGGFYRGNPAELSKVSAYRYFKIPEQA